MPKRKSDKERFIKAARELECDESPAAFDAAVKLTKAKLMTNEQVKRAPKSAKILHDRPTTYCVGPVM
jgi:hypothetical protein